MELYSVVAQNKKTCSSQEPHAFSRDKDLSPLASNLLFLFNS
jgi:hypothetical protein